jgi:hypothetical protein
MRNKIVKITAITFCIITLSYSCVEKVECPQRQVVKIKKKVFYGMKEKNEKDSLLTLMVKDMNTIFEMPILNKEKDVNEIRIFYINAFGSLFFRQQFISDTMVADLYQCSGERKGDSLFMNLHNHISFKEKRNYNGEFDASGANEFAQQLEVQKEDILDDLSQFIVQVKFENSTKFFLIDKPFSKKPETIESKYVVNVVKRINKDFNFNFNSSVKGILDTAMTRPYGKTCVQ